MPTGTMRRMFVESSSSESSGSGREAEPAVVLCAPRPRRVHAQPCSADLILGPPPFLLNASSGSNSRKVPAVLQTSASSWKKFSTFFCFLVLIFFCMDLCLTRICSFLLQQREGKSKTREVDDESEEEGEGGWALFGGSPPARADNPLVHDPHFLLNQRNHAAADFNLAAVFDHHLHHHSRAHHHHHSRAHHHHIPTTYSNSNSHSFAPSYTHAAPAVRIQGFDVAACRGSHGTNGGGRVLSARA
ncbi:unnamed protein product [Triticum turgidum subsp. durum]|uniref:Uncharacterized protein n=1 Tax=Triticum turgidum subsp. durum TaxID=4567 RepID=A0A9R1QXQ6_TRITD|nr:unnamed protein product [Triticum turgidum subsp. durum]